MEGKSFLDDEKISLLVCMYISEVICSLQDISVWIQKKREYQKTLRQNIPWFRIEEVKAPRTHPKKSASTNQKAAQHSSSDLLRQNLYFTFDAFLCLKLEKLKNHFKKSWSEWLENYALL